ncbi:hypothetical protein ACIRJ3_32715 [Streptomyces anulatus]
MTDPRPSFVCPECSAESWHPEDVAQGYCGRCHFWTGDPTMYAAWKAERASAAGRAPETGSVAPPGSA